MTSSNNQPPLPTTTLWTHPYVHLVLEFMQEKVPPNQLCGVAEAVARMAKPLWGHHGETPVAPLVLFKIPKADSETTEQNCK